MLSCALCNLDLRRLISTKYFDKKENSVELSDILKIKTSRQSNMNEEKKWFNELAQTESRGILEIYQNLIKMAP